MLFADLGVERFGVVEDARPALAVIQDERIPRLVQVDGALAVEKEHELSVAAPVAVAICAVQRLVKIGDEMHDVLQRLGALVLRFGLVREDSLERRDLVDDILTVLAVASGILRGLSRGDVDVVPGRRLLALAPDVVRPACDLGVGDVHALAEQLADLRRSLWSQPLLGDEVDDLVAVAAQARTIAGSPKISA